MSDSRQSVIRQPDEGDLFHAGGDRYRFLALAGETDSQYGLWEAVVPPGGGPPPHLHRREEEGFYVIEGELTIHVDGREVTAGPGAFVNMPKGFTHWFRNNTDHPAKLLVIVAPGGMEAMFRETGKPASDDNGPIPALSKDEIQRIGETAPRYGIEIVGPPTH
ncbi:MAG: cupin domain-containing protein [Planctomycetota bacterium]